MLADGATAALVLGHGAGGGIGAPDLQAAARAAAKLGVSVALVEQPYRVAGRRSQPPAAQLDAAWLAVIEQLRAGPLGGARLITGGRSAGARVACRTAAERRRRRRAVPRVPGAPAGQGRRPRQEQAAGARCGARPGAGRAGRERPVRDAARRAAPDRLSAFPATIRCGPRPRSRTPSRRGCRDSIR